MRVAGTPANYRPPIILGKLLFRSPKVELLDSESSFLVVGVSRNNSSKIGGPKGRLRAQPSAACPATEESAEWVGGRFENSASKA